ncbi:DUF3179 domain-containing (seleno)protein [Flavitalea flava]
MRSFLLITGLLFLIALEILRVYYIMPFPGSQHGDSVSFAYFLNNNIWRMRLFCLILVLPPLFYYFRKGKSWQKAGLSVIILFYGIVFYFFNFRFLADKMFYQPKEKSFATGAADTTAATKLILGVSIHGEAKAYPVEVIGYHHQVKDTVGGQPILVTYCTVCRTGRVFSPFVNGKYEQFRLVGMDHFNAMFEDAATKSWWQQATGIAITGPLKGTRLEEIPSAQMQLGDWTALHPGSLTLQPDPNFRAKYDSLKGYDEGTISGSLEKRDSGSWKFKSWVIGVSLDVKQAGIEKGARVQQSKAYDWNRLVKERVIRDSIGNIPLLLTIQPNNRTFYVLTHPDSLRFQYDSITHVLKDVNTQSTWQPDGKCIAGTLTGQSLPRLQAYQEFWHSWKTFHPNTGGEGIPAGHEGTR